MNIVLLPSPPFEEIGGVSTHVFMLAKGLGELGHNVVVIGEYPPRWFRVPFIRVPETVLAKISLFHARRYRRWVEDVYYAISALWKTNGRIDVLNIQNVQHAGMAMLLRRLTRCRTVITVHGYLTYEAEDRKWCAAGDRTHNWLWAMEQSGYDRFDAVITVGHAVENYVRKFTDKPVFRIRNGLDTDYFCPDNHFGSIKGAFTILFAGMLQESKGLMDTLEAIRILVKDFNKRGVLLKIAGRGNQEALARQYVADNDLEANVTFLGALSKDKMPDFYRAGHIFLSTSKMRGLQGQGEEPFLYTSLEAMACGKPVVAYKTGGLPDQVHDGVNGFLVAPGNIGDLADRIKELIDNPDLCQEMGAAARSRCHEDFSHLQMARRYTDVYKECVM